MVPFMMTVALQRPILPALMIQAPMMMQMALQGLQSAELVHGIAGSDILRYKTIMSGPSCKSATG